MRTRLLATLLVALGLLAPAQLFAQPQVRGPQKGTLIIAGGGRLGPDVLGRFLKLAGGAKARIVVIPTAGDPDVYGPDCDCLKIFTSLGVTRGQLTVLHTRDRKLADTEAFAAPLRTATAVWFVGGRQWRLVDSYAGTRTQAEIEKVLARGGVIGGTSAGATIQGSYLVRGARSGNEIMMAPGYEAGFALMQGVAIDQHVTARHREGDLDPVVVKHPEVLGLGIDQSTAIEVTRDRFKVIGVGYLFVHDGKEQPNGGHYYLLRPGAASACPSSPARPAEALPQGVSPGLERELTRVCREVPLLSAHRISNWFGCSPRLFFGSSPDFPKTAPTF